MGKKHKDINQLAKSIVDIVTGADDDKTVEIDPMKASATALGRKGGLKGGIARANSLTPERRVEIAKKAAAKRWGK